MEEQIEDTGKDHHRLAGTYLVKNPIEELYRKLWRRISLTKKLKPESQIERDRKSKFIKAKQVLFKKKVMSQKKNNKKNN